jgi:hypothetical protein
MAAATWKIRPRLAITVDRPGGRKPVMHLHPEQDEHFEVLEGAVSAKIGDEVRGTAPASASPCRAALRTRWPTPMGLATRGLALAAKAKGALSR